MPNRLTNEDRLDQAMDLLQDIRREFRRERQRTETKPPGTALKEKQLREDKLHLAALNQTLLEETSDRGNRYRNLLHRVQGYLDELIERSTQ